MTRDVRAEFRAIYESEVAYVCSWLARLGVAPGDVEDLAHDVFVTFYRRFDDYDRTRPVRPWICGILFRAASDYRRSARSRKETLTPEVELHAAPLSSDATLLAREEVSLVEKALNALPIEDRIVFGMHEIDGMSIPEIARALEINVNTLYSRVRVIRGEFLAAYRRFERKGGGA